MFIVVIIEEDLLLTTSCYLTCTYIFYVTVCVGSLFQILQTFEYLLNLMLVKYITISSKPLDFWYLLVLMQGEGQHVYLQSCVIFDVHPILHKLPYNIYSYYMQDWRTRISIASCE